MPSIFPETEAYLKAFYEAKKDLYKSIENDFHPRRHAHYGYSNIKEEHRNQIHESAKGFYLFFGNGNDILDLRVPETYGTPKKALKGILDYRDYLEKDKESMIKLIQEYRNEPNAPFPIETIIEKSTEIIDVLDHVLEFDEIAPYLDEELYNVYVGIPFNSEAYFGFNKKDIEKLFEAIKQGEDFVRIDGRKILIKGFSNLFIYNNLFTKYSDKADLKHIIPLTKKTLRIKTTMDLLSHHGQDVTSEFDVPDPVEDSIEEESTSVKKAKPSGRKIFVSHSSKDQELVTQFVENVLMLGMGVKRDEIFYTSGIGMRIKTGEDFKIRIEKEMQGARAVIQILSENYKKSEICLNEMGAAWALKDIVIPLLAPGYNYDTGFIHSNSQQIKLTDITGLMSIYEDHKDKLFDSSVRSDALMDKINRFVKSLE